MEIRLVSVVEDSGQVRARVRAQAPKVGVTIWLEVRFRAPENTTRREWAVEAYDRALAVLDPT